MSITPSLVVNRSSCVVGGGVYCDASGTTATGITYPRQELFYRFTATGISGNHSYGNLGAKNRMQGAPYAAFVFETAGTWTITLYVTDGVTAVETTQQITVYDWDDTNSGITAVHFFSNDTTYAVGTPATGGKYTRHDSVTTWATVVATINTGVAVFVEWGDTFSASSWGVSADGPIVIGANPYGSGTKPLVQGSGSGLTLGNSTNHDFGNVNFKNLAFDGVNNGGGASAILGISGTSANITFVSCDWNNFVNGYHGEKDGGTGLDATNTPSFVAPLFNHWFSQDCTLTDISQYGLYGFFRRFAFLGGKITSAIGSAGTHTMRFQYYQGVIISNCEISDTQVATGRALLAMRGLDFDDHVSATIDGDPALDGYWSKEAVICDNKLLPCALDDSPIQMRATASELNPRWRRNFIERNWLVVNTTNNVPMNLQGDELTVRNNLIDMTLHTAADSRLFEITNSHGTAHDSQHFYNNTIVDLRTSAQNIILVQGGSTASTNMKIKNNLAWGPNNSGTYSVNDSGWGAGFDASNNSTSTQYQQDTTPFVNAAPDTPTECQLDAAEYADAAGAESVPVFDDYFGNIRDLNDMDMGLHAFTEGALPGVGGSFLNEPGITAVGLMEAQTNPSIISVW